MPRSTESCRCVVGEVDLNTVKRSSLKIGDLFKNAKSKNIYMHSGKRTKPPSAGSRGGTVGYQSILVRGSTKLEGEDGAFVTFEGNKQVTPVGIAEIKLVLNFS